MSIAKKILSLIIVCILVTAPLITESAYAVCDEVISETVSASNLSQSVGTKNEYSTTSIQADSKYANVNHAGVSGGGNDKVSWIDAPYYGVAMIEQYLSSTNAYLFSYAKGQYAIVSDFLSDGLCYGQMLSPAVPSTNDFYRFSAGESLFVNYDVIKGFDNATSSIVYHDAPVEFAIYIFGGTYAQNSSSGSGLSLMASYLGSTRCSFKLTAPQSDWIYRFFIAIPDTTMTEFGGWFSMSQYDYDYKTLEAEDSIEYGNTVTVNLGSNETELILDNDFVLTNAKAYEIELTANNDLCAYMSSTQQNLGGHLYLADENMDVIANTWIGSGAFAFGSTYADVVLPIMVPKSGTYYIIVAGQCMNDTGPLSCTITDWDYAYEVTANRVFNIDVAALSQASSSDGDGFWEYEYDIEAGFGCLSLLQPATFNISGENTKVAIDAHNGVELVMNSATVGTIWLMNYWSPVTVRCNGICNIRNEGQFVYTVYNYPTYNSGVYFVGNELNITGPMGLMVENAPVHIFTKKMSGYAVGGYAGYYLVPLWVSGALLPALTLGENATFDGQNKLSIMYQDANGYMKYGYTVSTLDKLYCYGNPNYYMISSSFTLTTDSGFGLLGDMNGDGVVKTVDALILLRYYVGWSITVPTDTADINGDGKISITDPLLILRHVTGWDISFFN